MQWIDKKKKTRRQRKSLPAPAGKKRQVKRHPVYHITGERMDQQIKKVISQRMKPGDQPVQIKGNIDQWPERLSVQHLLLHQYPVQGCIIVRQKTITEDREIDQQRSYGKQQKEEQPVSW